MTTTSLIARLTAAVAVIGLLGWSPAHADSAPSRHVDPATLPAASTPVRLPYLDGRTERIVLPDGRRPSIARLRSGGVRLRSGLFHVRNGFLLNAPVYRRIDADEAEMVRNRVVLVRPSGRIRVVVRTKRQVEITVASDGRWFVFPTYSPDPTRITYHAVRVSDGRTIGRRTFTHVAQLGVMAAGQGKVIMREAIKRGRGSYDRNTLSWRPASGSVRVLDRRRHAFQGTLPMAASIGAHRYVVTSGRRELVVDSRSRHVLWRAPAGEHVVSFSPHDSRAMTVESPSSDEDFPFWDITPTVRVRNARTGALQATFTGQLSASSIEEYWEDDASLLLRATSDYVLDSSGEEGSYPHAAVVRCSVRSGRCERLSVPIAPSDPGADIVRRTSN